MSWIIFYLASTECGSDMKRKVDWDDEENEESRMALSKEASETEASDEEESSDGEPRINPIQTGLFFASQDRGGGSGGPTTVTLQPLIV